MSKEGSVIPKNELIEAINGYNPNADIKLIEEAYDFASEMHKEQKRASGEPYFLHPVQVAGLLTQLNADSATICAALLHDVVEDTNVSIEEIKEQFGEEVAGLVEGLTKIESIHFESRDDYTAENLRKVLFATTKDIRVMLVKLADRLHNMRTLKFKSPEKQKLIAEETMNIYAPIAHKLGIPTFKGELEDLSMKFILPKEYEALKNNIDTKRGAREHATTEFIDIIKTNLSQHNVDAEVYGRAKYFYSIYRKMKRDSKDFNEIYDLIAIRIIVKTIPECYTALGVVHDLFKPMPGRFKDYVSVPKANGYQSLHTSVVGNHGKVLEVQIRSEDMEHLAEEGVAAHWRYHNVERDKKFDKKIEWLKQLLQWKSDANAKDFIETLKIDLFEKEIVVFTPKGTPISLPEGSTPVDFAFEVHTNVGLHCSKTEINGKMVPLDTLLQSGDIVNVVTQNNASPSRQWLKFIKTSKSRSKIRKALNIEYDHDHKAARKSELDDNEMSEAALLDLIKTDVKKKSQMKLSKCCGPVHGDDIVAFYTKDGKVTVHKADCPNIHALDENKKVEVSWRLKGDEGIVKIRAMIDDRVGILSEILGMISQDGISVCSINSNTHKERVSVTFALRLPENLEPEQLVIKIRNISDVVAVEIVN
ncbi:bifunctional (p)ppGpp synthetase/guanosine-3',5'-bis(diphosphate) 3'-pyrophosphohydrolase [Candidatus Woesearchaeota archaeon]|jgi:GTP diphosphokinase / guanosine-3',5'-bis(diphosphate) 3'-diphosphatase|nr:bifunctional (p)ppGpp synthetase/guanosine-3',5'-bis(diphosphate) 3'-pyrophosphohydrolase [Candidatus Woesearchaeota archaeon]MBT3538267.1 bifunctional (p)ppGpp synthetase/guanosine-3',5'-bis(diphosphate) 3'-pyrophosphohydrolase [Candidatus Woesearchaeota archaeon]MBT4696975.1 bifunctional (p)ppGpp synthetase/guanosine-3',5'-bis(diphosphate) 3'-pyrophosphohydrolase [Candidatus Woesearchaeota archaeon]MBT4717433.1 bifunctional (p)ppGpp synthetase/guanosine-3',5'-bis(diphosphate) 3'-pyrophospho